MYWKLIFKELGVRQGTSGPFVASPVKPGVLQAWFKDPPPGVP